MVLRTEPSTPFNEREQGSLGNTRYILVRQYQFPDLHDDAHNSFAHADFDRIFFADWDHTRAYLEKFTGSSGEMGSCAWVRSAHDTTVLLFCKKLMKVEEPPIRHGYRITATMNRSNGHAILSFRLSAKDESSVTRTSSKM